MIQRILTGIFKLIISLVSLLLSPIDALITQFFPSIAEGLSYVVSFFDYIGDLMFWVLSWFHLPQAFVTLLVGYWTFKLTVPHLVHRIKLAVAWYHKLKP